MFSSHSFALFFSHTLNLNVRLEPVKSLFPGLQFGHKNDLERSPDERVMPVWSFHICVGSRSARAGIAAHVRDYAGQQLNNVIFRPFLTFSFPLFFSPPPCPKPWPPKPWFPPLLSTIHHGSCIKDGEQEKINIFFNRLEFQNFGGISSSLLPCLILEVGVLLLGLDYGLWMMDLGCIINGKIGTKVMG